MTEFRAGMVVASDIHMISADDFKGRKLRSAIEIMKKGEVEYFVLLGDIFDFCLGHHPYFQKRFAPIGRALESLVESGTKVIYIEGNHEFRIDGLPWKGVEFITEGEAHNIQLSSGHTFQMAHGDLIYSHNRYRKFRKFVKSRPITGLVRWIPGVLMNRIATGSAQISRAQDVYRKVNHHAILSEANRWLSKGPSSYGLFGHFHVPYAEPRTDGQPGGLYSVKCWDEPNFLVFKDQNFFRWDIKDSLDVALHPAMPILPS